MPGNFTNHTTEFCITDVGSTTTKAILFRKEETWRFHRAEAPTTVEKPHEDVTIGVVETFRALERETGAALLRSDEPAVPYLSTSSAGGGLAVVVTGLVREVTSKSAERVALGAGAILLDVVAMNDGRTPYEKIEVLKTLRPDMILLAGGFDGDAISGPVYLAELINEAGLRPKLSKTADLPVLFAGNANADALVRETLGEGFLFRAVPNIRPTSDKENLEPAREAIHDLFMDHVMSQAPGYESLISWVDAPIVPTPSAFGKILALASQRSGQRILAIDIGGATTDVFTAEGGRVSRTVSANLGMSYSILNVAEAGGIRAIGELLDPEMSEAELWNRIGNKYLQPTRLPRDLTEMKVEWAAAAVAIREAVKDHLRVLEGISISRSKDDLEIRNSFISSSARKDRPEEEALSLSGYDLIIGSGGILSHSPRDVAALVLINALQPQDPVSLAVDSAFMFPHLGVLSETAPDLALELFFECGLVRLGPLLVACRQGKTASQGVRIRGTTESGRKIEGSVALGEVKSISLAPEEKATVTVAGASVGALGRRLALEGGSCGFIVDARERPLRSPANLLVPRDLDPPVRSVELSERKRISIGILRVQRELAIAGEVFVEAGVTVRPDTLIARSSRQFLRPFFLDLRASLAVDPDQVPRFMLKSVGDDITAGDLVAQRKVSLVSSKEHRATVSGRIERILPSGTVVVRENPEDAIDLTAVNVAKELRMRPDQIKPYLRVQVGQPIEKGHALASMIRPGDVRNCLSPVRGKVKEISLTYGIVMIEPLLEELEIRAWMPGQVETVSDRGCWITNEGVEIVGSWGRGGEAYGTLASRDPGPGRILIKESSSRQDLVDLESKQVAGLITGGLALKDTRDLELTYTIVMIGEFGGDAMDREVRDHLRAREGRLALLDGTTELRVGVRRPRILLPGSESVATPGADGLDA